LRSLSHEINAKKRFEYQSDNGDRIMSLPRPTKSMSDDELCDWASFLINRRAPESSSLDYKADISPLERQSDKIELAKDVSSFANQTGGIILYGVPEEKPNNTPIPKSLSECGIEVPSSFLEKIENILMDVIMPPLPELDIRLLNIKELAPKSLIMVYHPESWNKPHMVEKYDHFRYYRRGNFSSVPMEERQIEAAYLFRKASLAHAKDFFATGDFREIPSEGRFVQVILCPRFSLIRREEMREKEFKNWVDSNPPMDRTGYWVPFLDGWSFLGYPEGKFHGRQYEFRLFHNGGVCFTRELDEMFIAPTDEKKSYLDIKRMDGLIKNYVLSYSNKAFEYLKISGPLSIQVSLYNVETLRAIDSGRPKTWFCNPNIGEQPIEKPQLKFVEETSISELRYNTDQVLERLMDRLASAFGVWRRK